MRPFEKHQIHPTAIIGENVRFGENVTIGAFATIYDNVVLGDNAVVGPHCTLGEPVASFYGEGAGAYANPTLTIGANAVIRSYSLLYAGSTIAENFECGHRVTIREGTTIGRNVRVGTLSDIQGHCSLGDYVRLHSNVHIGQGSRIGNFVWLFPYVVLTNDPHPPSNTLEGVTIEEYAVVATMTVVLPGVKVGRNALVGAHALVRADVEAEAVVVGNPGKQITTIHAIRDKSTQAPVYPWQEHFDRGMPWEGVGFSAWSQQRETTQP